MGYFSISLFKRFLRAKMILSCLLSFKMNSTKELSVLTFKLIYSTLVFTQHMVSIWDRELYLEAVRTACNQNLPEKN